MDGAYRRHLVDRVLPMVAPMGPIASLQLSYRTAYDSKLMADILSIFIRAASVDCKGVPASHWG